MKNLANITHKYYCGKCSKFINITLPHYENRPFDICCSVCDEDLKYKGSADARVSSIGNCGYISAERISEQNIKRIGKDAYHQMCLEDPIGKARAEQVKHEKPWWRKNMDKPLNLSEIKDTKKYIETGEKT